MTATLPPLIQAMLSPAMYPHPVGDRLELLQTHISFVVLTGSYAYKVKKPVNFGFLDFSTLEQRHHFCQEEVRLNQRLAPELYLGVVAIAARDGGFAFAEPGEPVVEYAVKMQQFDQQDLLIHLHERGELTPDIVTEIAAQLARFHQQAATNERISQFGSLEAMQAVAADNYHHTEKYVGVVQSRDRFERTRAATDRLFAELAPLFAQRLAAGKVRECHGDVHLKNICLVDGRPCIFDCIEFNEPFRNSDVLYDAAFLAMDLQYRGRSDLANLFLNTYLEQTGDYDGAPLLPLFLSLRAYIRAKVTSFLLDDASVPEAAKATARQEADAYYQLAWEAVQPARGQIVIMSGTSGSGKSTIARQLAPHLQALHLRSDAIRKHLAGIDLMARGGDDLYTPAMTAKTYDRLAALGVSLATQGFAVILDAKYDRVDLRHAVLKAARDRGIPFHILYCHAPVDVLKQRLRDRAAANSDIADATADLVDRQRATFEPFDTLEHPYVIEIDTTVLEDLAAFLRAIARVLAQA